MPTSTDQRPFAFSPPTPSSRLGAGASGSLDALVQEARREISAIVREVAAEARKEQTLAAFLRMLADRMLRAMSAEGIVVWRRCGGAEGESSRFEPITRLGMMTDLTMPKSGSMAHARLLEVIADEGAPVVVPPTPGASEPDVPANPTESPAAVVPVSLHPVGPTEYLLEAFLKTAGNAATQRGYLRFVSQLGELTAEFLRHHELRTGRRARQLTRVVDDAIETLHRFQDVSAIERGLVDAAAELFGFARVGLCRVEHPTRVSGRDKDPGRGVRPKLVAVSHVNTIAEKSAAADQLRDASTVPLDRDGSIWNEASLTGAESGESLEALLHRCTVAASDDGKYRLACFDRADEIVDEESSRSELSRLLRHAELAVNAVDSRYVVPWNLGWMPRTLRPGGGAKRSTRQRLGRWLFAAALSGVAIVPVPRVVTAKAIIRPVDVQLVCAHRDAIVREIHVEHGQRVAAGDLLITLHDPDLEERIGQLESRRAVLAQQMARWVESIVVGGTDRHSRQDQFVGQQILVEEEIRGVDSQLDVLQRIKRDLALRADRDGRVDAWRLDERLQDRPLRRGEPLLQVVGHQTDWIAEADVPQKRIAWVRERIEADERRVFVSPDSDPDRRWPGMVESIGPAVVDPLSRLASTSVRVRLDSTAASEFQQNFGAGSQEGMPAHVSLRCGSSPLIAFLFGDAYREVSGRMRMYWAGTPIPLDAPTETGIPFDE